MSKLFKPILPKSDELCLTSTVLEIPTNKHSLIICYDGGINYYYLKCRSAIDLNDKLKTKHFNEVLIHKNFDNPNKVLYKDVYVDISHIFIINQGDLEKLLINHKKMFIWGDELKIDDLQNIGLKMYENLTLNPPLITIVETIIENNNLNFKTLLNSENINQNNYWLINNIKSIAQELAISPKNILEL